MVQILVLVARSLTETLSYIINENILLIFFIFLLLLWTEDDRSGERFRDAAHCDVGKSVLSYCADTAFEYIIILFIIIL